MLDFNRPGESPLEMAPKVGRAISGKSMEWRIRLLVGAVLQGHPANPFWSCQGIVGTNMWKIMPVFPVGESGVKGIKKTSARLETCSRNMMQKVDLNQVPSARSWWDAPKVRRFDESCNLVWKKQRWKRESRRPILFWNNFGSLWDFGRLEVVVFLVFQAPATVAFSLGSIEPTKGG